MFEANVMPRRPIVFSTLVDDGHVWHRSLDGEPLAIQANAKFAHRLDWSDHCTLCDRVALEVAA